MIMEKDLTALPEEEVSGRIGRKKVKDMGQ